MEKGTRFTQQKGRRSLKRQSPEKGKERLYRRKQKAGLKGYMGARVERGGKGRLQKGEQHAKTGDQKRRKQSK